MTSVLHGVASLHSKSGGPARSVIRLVDALANQKCIEVHLLSQTLSNEPWMQPDRNLVEASLVRASSAFRLSGGLAYKKLLQQQFMNVSLSIIHSHGVWHPINHWLSRFAKQKKIPLIIQPRGMLEPWALAQKSWKKRLAMQLYQESDLASAAIFVATSDMEYQNLRQLGIMQPIAIIPNGVQLEITPTATTFALKPDRERVALFLSRIHPKKGLLELIEAWAICKPVGWRLKIAGPDEGGYLDVVKKAIIRHGLGAYVEYVGEVEGDAKSSLYQLADLFVLPTYSENFGLVVAEALAHGVPVITTKGAPWSDLTTFNCGWWVDTGLNALVPALHEAVSLKDSERVLMGQRGKKYVQRYNWDAIAHQTLEVYDWVLNPQKSQIKPDSVMLT